MIYFIAVMFTCCFCSDWSRVLVNHAGNIVYSHRFSVMHRHAERVHNINITKWSKLFFHHFYPRQAVNFAFIPPVARTTFLGGIALTFTIYLCHLRQQPGHKFE